MPEQCPVPRKAQGPGGGMVNIQHRGTEHAVACDYRIGEGEGLIYFHGLGTTRRDFEAAWSVFEWRDCSLLAFDAPGCGGTRWDPARMSLSVDDIVAVAEALVDRLSLDALTVIGHSMGGLAGLLFTLRQRRRVRRFVSVEGNLGPPDCAMFSRRAVAAPLRGREGELLRAFERGLTRAADPSVARAGAALRANVEETAFVDYCRSIVEYSDGYPLLDELVALDRPRLFVYGEDSPTPWHRKELAAGGVELVAIPRSAHYPAWSNPEAYYRALVRFVGHTAP